MADPFTLAYLLMKPNTERERWTLTQAAWRSLAARLEMTVEDERDDTWPVTKRELGVLDGVTLTFGFDLLEAEDLHPLETLTCDVGSASLLSRFTFNRVTTGDAVFDEHFTARANDDEKARELLDDGLRAALERLGVGSHFRYEHGLARVSCAFGSLESPHLEAMLGVIVAACRRSAPAPYR